VFRQRVDVLEGVAHLGLVRHLLAIALDRNRVLTVNGQEGVEQCIAIAAAVQQWQQMTVRRRQNQRLVPEVEG
jgi:hypothetical protein